MQQRHLFEFYRQVLQRTAEVLRKSFGLVIIPTLKTFKTTGEISFGVAQASRTHSCPCTVEFDLVRKIEEQQEFSQFAIIATDAMHRDSDLSRIINEAASAAELRERGFLTGILMIVAQAPMQRIFAHELEEKLRQLDPLFKHDIHPDLGPWKDSLRAFAKRGYLDMSMETTSTASSDNKRVPAYRFGPNARAHVGIGGISCVLKEVESGFTVKSGEALQAVGNNVMQAWYGLERLRNKNPLKDPSSAGRGKKRARS